MFLGHYSSITMFYHTHVVDGISYTHSHFYWLNKSSNSVALPQHSQGELQLIQDFNQITWNSTTLFPAVEQPVFVLLTRFISAPKTLFPFLRVVHSSLRAPPLLSAC